MPSILVPIDYSHAAESAANYAINFSAAINGEIRLIHIINASLSAVDNYFIDSMDEVFDSATIKLKSFADELIEKSGGKSNIQIWSPRFCYCRLCQQ